MKKFNSSCPVCMAHVMFESDEASEKVLCDECLSPLVIEKLPSGEGVFLQIAPEEDDG